MFIGFINIANAITLLGLSSSITAIVFAGRHSYCLALMFFLIAGLCDMVDGTAARRTQKRTNRSRIYGVQLDSLCDMVSFGVAPCFIAYHLGYETVFDVLIYIVFCICAATRLAYFNAVAMEKPDFSTKSFIGVPVPFSCFSTTVLMMFLSFGAAPAAMAWAFRIVYLLVALAYILRVRVPKPTLKVAMIFGAVIFLLFLFTIMRWNTYNITTAVENYISLTA